MTTPDPNEPIPTDNTERPEDGVQDVAQDPSLDYSLPAPDVTA